MWQAGCCASPHPALSPRAASEHPAPEHRWCHHKPRLSFCSQSARREEMAMLAVRRDDAVQSATGPHQGHETERESYSQGLLPAPGPCWGWQHHHLAGHCPGLSSQHRLERGSLGTEWTWCLAALGSAWPHAATSSTQHSEGHRVSVALGPAPGWVAQGGCRSLLMPHFELTPASPVEIIHARSGLGLAWPCRASRQPHLLVQ